LQAFLSLGAKVIDFRKKSSFLFNMLWLFLQTGPDRSGNMNIEDIRRYCLNKPAVTESFPFDEVTLVFKVAGKMFALVNLDGTLSINLKCDPEKALELREHYPAVLPGYHMNKRLWNTVLLDATLDNDMVKSWIDDSYNLVVAKLPKKDRVQADT